MPAPRRLHLYAMLVLLAVVWGVAFPGIKEVLREVSAVTLTLLRFAVAAVFLGAIMAVRPATRPRLERRDLPRILILGLAGVPGYHLSLNWGEQHTTASVASLVVSTAPVMVALLSAAVLREPVTVRRATGIALAFGGVALLALTSRSRGGEHATTLIGVLVTLIAPVSWAIYTVVGRPLAARVPPMHITAAGMLLGSIALLPLVRASTFEEAAALSARGWAWVLLLGGGSSVVGYLIFTWALGHMGATRAAVTLYMVPVVALVSAWLILDEPLGLPVAAAAALVITGVALAQHDRLRDRPAEAVPAGEPVA